MSPHESVPNQHRRVAAYDTLLLPPLPDDIAHLILCKLPPAVLFSVCRSWRRLLYSEAVPPFDCLFALLCPLSSSSGGELHLAAFDPISSHWNHLPSPPVRLLLRHPSFLSRTLAVQSLSVADRLVMIAATVFADLLIPALDSPLVFDPSTCNWEQGPAFSAPRRWCTCGSVGSATYVASGVSADWSRQVAVSAERWKLDGEWETIAPLPNTYFSREAIDAVGMGKKLYMVNVHGESPKEGMVYDTELDRWEEMPFGMKAGWNGPVAGDGEIIYCVDESRGILKAYDQVEDLWNVVLENTCLRGATQLAVKRGKVVVICGGGNSVMVVNAKVHPPSVWIERPPKGSRLVALHILPRPIELG